MLPQYPEHYILMKNIFSWKQTEQISNPKNFFFPWILKKMLIPALLMIFSGKWLQSFIKKFQKHFHGWRSAVSKQSSGTAFYLLTCASSSILRIKWCLLLCGKSFSWAKVVFICVPYNRLHRDITLILGCIRSLPSGNLSESGTPNWGQLDEFLVQRFGSEAGWKMSSSSVKLVALLVLL